MRQRCNTADLKDILPPLIETVRRDYEGRPGDEEFELWRKEQFRVYQILTQLLEGRYSRMYGQKRDIRLMSDESRERVLGDEIGSFSLFPWLVEKRSSSGVKEATIINYLNSIRDSRPILIENIKKLSLMIHQDYPNIDIDSILSPVIDVMSQGYDISQGISFDNGDFKGWLIGQKDAYETLIAVTDYKHSRLEEYFPSFLIKDSREHLLVNYLSGWYGQLQFTDDKSISDLSSEKRERGVEKFPKYRDKLLEALQLGSLLYDEVQESHTWFGVLYTNIRYKFPNICSIGIDKSCVYNLKIALSPVQCELIMCELTNNYEKYGKDGEVDIRKDGNYICFTLTNELKEPLRGLGHYSSGRGLGQLKEMIEGVGGSFIYNQRIFRRSLLRVSEMVI